MMLRNLAIALCLQHLSVVFAYNWRSLFGTSPAKEDESHPQTLLEKIVRKQIIDSTMMLYLTFSTSYYLIIYLHRHFPLT